MEAEALGCNLIFIMLFMNKLQYQTNQSRLKGVCIAVVPAILSAAFIVALIMTSINADYLDFPGDWIKMVLLLSLVFGTGQVIATFSAVAVWVVFHKLGLRHWSLAVAVGFVVPFIAIYVWAVDAPDTSYHLVDGAALASLLAVWGGVIAFILWRIAYRREEIPPLKPNHRS